MDGGGVDADLVRAGVDDAAGVLHLADAAADGERDEDFAGGAGDDIHHGVALVTGGGDIEEDELVGALVIVAAGQLDGVARIAQADEVDSLDDAAASDVQAWNDAPREHRE